MTKKRCLKLMMSHLCGQLRKAERWHRVISGMLKPPVRNVDILLRFHAISYHLAVAAKILADDNNTIIASVDGSRVLYDKANPRTEIFIEEMSDDDQPV